MGTLTFSDTKNPAPVWSKTSPFFLVKQLFRSAQGFLKCRHGRGRRKAGICPPGLGAVAFPGYTGFHRREGRRSCLNTVVVWLFLVCQRLDTGAFPHPPRPCCSPPPSWEMSWGSIPLSGLSWSPAGPWETWCPGLSSKVNYFLCLVNEIWYSFIKTIDLSIYKWYI